MKKRYVVAEGNNDARRLEKPYKGEAVSSTFAPTNRKLRRKLEALKRQGKARQVK